MFRKKTSTTSKIADQAPVDRLATLIVRSIHRMQELFVQLMNIVVKKTGWRGTNILFIVLVSGSALHCVYLTCSSLNIQNKVIQLFRPSAIQRPVTINEDVMADENDLIEDTITLKKLRQLNSYFDSIQQWQPGVYDSILQSRPGLIDSTRMLYQIYSRKYEAYEK